MNTRHSARHRRERFSGGLAQIFPTLISRSLVAILGLLTARLATAQMIDLNSNGMSDVWEQMYAAGGLTNSADNDGDGYTNGKEALAGTSPFSASSVPKITGATMAGPAFSVTIPCELGKQYQLQSVTTLGGTNWVVETNIVVRSGTTLTLTAPTGSNGKFFRTAVADVDTDGDGVSDWEEYKLGLDPLDALSNGQIDGLGQLMNDYAYATGKFASQNIFSITATDPSTVEPDPGQAATDVGVLTISRGGFPLKSVTVNFTLGTGAGFATEGVDHTFLPRSITFPIGVSSQNISVTPLANTNRHTSVVAMVKLLAGTNYTVSYASNASVVIYPSQTPGGTGLSGNYFTNSSTTYASLNNFNPTNLILSHLDPVIDFNYTNGTSPNLSNGLYSVRWAGQVQPQYSELYYFDMRSDDGCRLWVNDQLVIDKWVSQGVTDQIGTIALQGGTRYNLKLEYLQAGGKGEAHLYWYSASQPKQIIPAERLYPTNAPAAPADITSELSAVAFLGQPFGFTVTGANSATNFTATGLPPGLSITSSNGLISGIPSLAGNFQATVTASNTAGLGASLVNIQVIDTGSSVVREVWLGVPGTNIADIPVNTPASQTNTLGTLEGISGFGSNYGERIRGYLTATNTGNYYFWISGSDSAELWISNDNEPVNKMKRANVWPVGGGTTFRNWATQTNQQSKWLSLVAGQRYYIEILHKAGTTPDHWSVGWSQDPLGTNTTPAGVVPGYVLSRYYPLPVKLASGTLYSANLLALPGVNSTAVGSATLLVNANGTSAVLNYSVNGVAGAHVDHIYSDPYLASPKTLLFDIAAAKPQADGSYLWPITAAGSLSAADILEILIEGKATIEIQSAAFPAGEIGGHFTLANGAQVFSPPPAPPAWTDDHANPNAAARFLIQSTFGPSTAEIASVQSLGYDGWISHQFSLPATYHLPVVLANRSADPTTPYPSELMFNAWWQQSITAPDQLRQRVAFALSEIMVVSESGVLQDKSTALADYYDVLLDNSFGNFRDLLEAVTLTPAMGLYLDMRGNGPGSLITGIHANENYAREILQLFSIGLYRVWPDGSLILNSQNALIPTYDQNTIMGFASTFTGWNYYQTNQANGMLPTSFSPPANYTNPMVLVSRSHELGTKKLLDNVMIPAAIGAQTNNTTTNFDNYCSQNLEDALDSIFNNPNVGPFICRQLIQRLVTSNPSRDYLYRVVRKFNDNGAGVRGDMQAVIRAILTDYEARSTNFLSVPTFGKQREPLLRVTATARALPAPPNNGGTYVESGDQTIAITTTNAHRMNNSDTVLLSFTDTSGNPPPPAQSYSVTTTSTSTFTVTAPGLAAGTYGQTNNVLTITISGHGLATNFLVYLVFPTGGATNGIYQVASIIDNNRFTCATDATTTNAGSCLFPRLTGGGYVVSGRTNITVTTALPQALLAGDNVFLNFSQAGSPTDGVYTVSTILDPTHFTLVTATNNNQTQNGLTIYPLGANAVPLVRSGTVALQESTWLMNYTDTSSTYNLSQSPLRSPTVFNYFFPDYQFPGVLASAGITTPEFQLTSDTSVALQMNFLEAGLLKNTGNTNGLSSYNNANGAIVLDLGPWMTAPYTGTANLPALVDSLNSLLLAGQLSGAAKTNILSYVTNTASGYFPTGINQQRDRVRAIVHLLITSPEFTVQK
ncbi:MAG TPA: DUF1800 family protein [bacterium]|nr:DUF1800 family protein [bacterium]